LLWLLLGLKFSKQQKQHPEKESEKVEMFNNFKTFKLIESLYTLLIVIAVTLSINHIKYADYFILPVVFIYIMWLYKQMKLINDYFKDLQ
jgi:hypothetical protein